MTKLPCEIVMDLLPSYIDGLTSEETNQSVEHHLKECATCYKLYEDMKEPTSSSHAPQPEIDYLKKLRHNSRKKLLLTIGGCIITFLLFLCIQLFLLGSVNSSCNIHVKVTDTTYEVSATLIDSASVFTRNSLASYETGTQLTLYSGLSSPFHRSGTLQVSINKEEVGDYLIINGNTYYPDGRVLTALANQLYAERNPYIGNMSANSRLANTLNISSLGDYTNALQTTTQPYAWTLEFDTPISSQQEEFFNQKMTGYAYVLLALIDNVDSINWSYSTVSNGELKQMSITTEDANEFFQCSIKSFSESPEQIQTLLTKVNIR